MCILQKLKTEKNEKKTEKLYRLWTVRGNASPSMSYCPSEVDERVVAPPRPQSLSFVRIHHPPHTQYIQPKIDIEIKNVPPWRVLLGILWGTVLHKRGPGEMHTLELKKVIQKWGTKIAKRNIWQYNFLVQHVMEDKLLIPVVRYAKTSHIVERK